MGLTKKVNKCYLRKTSSNLQAGSYSPHPGTRHWFVVSQNILETIVLVAQAIVLQ